MKKPLLEIIAVTYGHNFQLKCFIDSIRSQTCPNWCLHIIHDGDGEEFQNLKSDLTASSYLDRDNIVLSATDKRYNDYGHSLREYGLNNRISDAQYITITNCDNYYVPVWLSEIDNISKHDKYFIYWDCVHNHISMHFDRICSYGLLNSKLEVNHIDMGCVAVNAKIAVEVGFPYRNFAGDWDFFNDCLKLISQEKIQKIGKILFVHN